MKRSERIDYIWYANYKQLLEYYNEFGNIDVPARYRTKNGFKLGLWLIKQRNNLVDQVKIDLLNSLKIKWFPQQDIWDDKYYILEDYYNRYGDVDVPYEYVTKQGFHLGAWLYNQRRGYWEKPGYKLTKDHTMLLNDLFMDWNPSVTYFLNNSITKKTGLKYKKLLLERVKHILEDLSYEMDGTITDINKQKEIENIIIKRMWR